MVWDMCPPQYFINGVYYLKSVETIDWVHLNGLLNISFL